MYVLILFNRVALQPPTTCVHPRSSTAIYVDARVAIYLFSQALVRNFISEYQCLPRNIIFATLYTFHIFFCISFSPHIYYDSKLFSL